MNFSNSFMLPAAKLSMTLLHHYKELTTLFDAISISEIKSYIAYSFAAEKFITIPESNDTSDDVRRREYLETSELHRHYDLIKCPLNLTYKINKAYIDYHRMESDKTTEFYIIFKCNINRNMLKLLRLMNSIRNASRDESLYTYGLDLKVLYRDKQNWEPISKSFVNLEHVKEIWETTAYKKNLEDKFIFIYKDMFCQKRETSDELNFNRRLVCDFKNMMRKRQNKKIERNWKKIKNS
jgi:hypothetical protein